MSFKTQAWFVAGGILALGAVVVLYQARSRPLAMPVQIPEDPAPVLSAKPQSPAGEFRLPIEELVARRDEIVPERIAPRELEQISAECATAEPKPITPGGFFSGGVYSKVDPGPPLPTVLSPPIEIQPMFTDSPTPTPRPSSPATALELPAPAAPTVAEPIPDLPMIERLRPETAPPPFPVPPSPAPGPTPTPAGPTQPSPTTAAQLVWPREADKKHIPLTGTYPCRLDSDLSLVLPTQVDAILGKPATLYLTPGPHGDLWITTADNLERVASAPWKSHPGSGDAPAKRRHFFAITQRIVVDVNGRFIVPDAFKSTANRRADDFILVGVGDHLELWTAKGWYEYLREHIQDLACVDLFSESGCRTAIDMNEEPF